MPKPSLIIVYVVVGFAVFVAEGMILDARYQNLNSQTLLKSYLFGVVAFLMVTAVSAGISKTRKTVWKTLALLFLVAVSSNILYFSTPYMPKRFTFIGVEQLYLTKASVVFAAMTLSVLTGILNARWIRGAGKSVLIRVIDLGKPHKIRIAIRYLRTALTR